MERSEKMPSETRIGQLVIDLQIKTNALEKGLETARKKLQEIEQNNKQLENSNKNLDTSFLAMSSTAVIALAKIGSAIKDCINEYNTYTQSMSSLQNVSEYTGESMTDLSKIMNKFGAYMTKSDLATTIKNFSLMGFEVQQTEQMIEALTNSAIRNRNANYTVSEAVRVASEGYRQGLSTLSDSAGVTENLSVMLDNYAKSIGKTANQLTETEKNQAYLNRTMYAAEPFASAMSEYLETLAGKQGEYSQCLRETQVAYTESIEPLLIKFEEFKTKIVSGLGDIVSSNKSASVGITTFAIALGSLTIVITAGKKAYDAYKNSTIAATLSTQGFTAALAANPIGALAITISLVVSALATYKSATEEQAEAQKVLNERTKQYNDILSGKYGYTDKAISDAKQRVSDIENEITYLNQIIRKRQELQQSQAWSGYNSEGTKSIKKELNDLIKKYEELSKKSTGSNKQIQSTLSDLNVELRNYKKYLSEANSIEKITQGLDTKSIKQQQQEAAQLKVNANQMQKYLNIVKTGNQSTNEYQNAIKELSKAYPEAANAEGILIKQAQNIINAEQLKADTAWEGSQKTIQSYIDMISAALNSEEVQVQIAQNIGIAYEELKPKLEGVLGVLQTMAGYQPTDVPNITPTSITAPKVSKASGGGSKSYSNKALDNYKKQIEHKKALDQISLQDEINMYQLALRKYAKTQDERWELEEKIYSLQKELREQNLDDYTAMIEHRKSLDKISLQDEINMYQYAYNVLAKTTEQKQELEEKLYELRKELAQKNKELLDQQTTDYEKYIQDQKNLRGAEYDSKEQERDLNKIIQMHKNYLNQIMKDERLSLDERKQLYQEEIDVIRDYEQQKRDLRVQSVDDTVSQLTSAITKQLEEMQEADKKAIEENIKLVEQWKEKRINAISEEYEARIEAIQKELDLLDKAEEDKTRAEEDAEYERKRNRLEQLIAYEHDATTKANYQKELDKLVADYQKTLDKRTLQDKKDALKNQQDLLKEEQDSKVQAIEDETDRQKEQYDKQLEELEKYYDKQKDLAQETAEKMLLNVEKNQSQILKLLNSYGNAYEITGQTLGEKLAQGINNGIADKIQNIIQKIQDTIDSGIENKIRQWTSGMYKYEAGTNKPQIKTVNVTQNNYIEQNPEMPSETYRKLRNIDEQLAATLAGM